MKKPSFTATQKSIALAVIGSMCVIATGVVSAVCSRKAEEKETRKEKVLAYAPAIGVGAATIGCIALGTKISATEIAGLSVACASVMQRFTNYKKAVEQVTDEDQQRQINEIFYLNEIDRLEAELAEREHPVDDDDWCTFIDSYSPYSFRAPYEQVEVGIEEAMKLYDKQGYLCWCDVFYLSNNKDTTPHDSIIGSEYTDYGVGWSKAMFDSWYEDTDYVFDICLTPVKGKPNTYAIEYSTIPEPCFMEY